MNRCGFCKYRRKNGIFYWCLMKGVKFYSEEDERLHGFMCRLFKELTESFSEKLRKE